MVPPYFSRDLKADGLPQFLKCDLYIDRDLTFLSIDLAGFGVGEITAHLDEAG